MKEYEVVFKTSISKKHLGIRVKAILIAMGIILPAKVKVITPNRVYLFRVK